MDVTWPATSLTTDDACEGVSERSWYKDYEAERQEIVRRRQEKYKAAKVNGPLMPLEGTWKLDTADIMDDSYNPRTLTFCLDGQKLWGAFETNQFCRILLVDPLPSEASNIPLL
ncbi:hypothetical protein BDR22DRAFT_891536 [Usnea florida]